MSSIEWPEVETPAVRFRWRKHGPPPPRLQPGPPSSSPPPQPEQPPPPAQVTLRRQYLLSLPVLAVRDPNVVVLLFDSDPTERRRWIEIEAQNGVVGCEIASPSSASTPARPCQQTLLPLYVVVSSNSTPQLIFNHFVWRYVNILFDFQLHLDFSLLYLRFYKVLQKHLFYDFSPQPFFRFAVYWEKPSFVLTTIFAFLCLWFWRWTRETGEECNSIEEQ